MRVVKEAGKVDVLVHFELKNDHCSFSNDHC